MSLSEQLSALMREGSGPEARDMFRSGVTLAKVTNITDDKKFNRVKCLPIGGKNDEETDWCYVMTPMGGKECGSFFFPQVDDLVVLAYLDGDPHRPFVLGSLWTTEVKPPLTVQDGKNEEYLLRTPKKIEMALHDTDKEQKLTVSMPSGAKIELDDKEQKISIQDKEGKNSLIFALKDGAITIQAEKKLTLVTGDAKIELTRDGNITEEGKAKLTEKFQNVDTAADAAVKIKGSSSGVTLSGSKVEAKADGELTLQGAKGTLKSSGMLEVSSSGITTVKGSMLKLN